LAENGCSEDLGHSGGGEFRIGYGHHVFAANSPEERREAASLLERC
jgi:hypothetical protein